MRARNENYIPDDPSEPKPPFGRKHSMFLQYCSDLLALPVALIFFVCGSVLFTVLSLLGVGGSIYSLWCDLKDANEQGLVPCPHCGCTKTHVPSCAHPEFVFPKATTFSQLLKDAWAYGENSLKISLCCLPISLVITLILAITFAYYFL